MALEFRVLWGVGFAGKASWDFHCYLVAPEMLGFRVLQISGFAGKASWDFHRHRVAPEIHAVLQEQLDRQRFQVLAAQVLGLKVLPSGKIQARLDGEDGSEDREFDYVINCTGPNAGTPLGFTV